MKSERVIKIQDTIVQATQALAVSLSTSYGPKGLDKMIIQDNKSIVTNDGATILSYYKTHPIHKILSNVSKTQDHNCGDGTTSVILLTCSLINQLRKLLSKNIHPCRIVEAIEIAKNIAIKYINDVKTKIGEKELLNAALTSLSSKIAFKSVKMANIVIDALKHQKKEDIRILKRIGKSIDEIEMYKSIIMSKDEDISSGKYKVLVLRFCLSAPKTNMDSKIVINDHSLIDKFVREERDYLIKVIRKIKNSGANLLIIQKSLLKESCSALAKHFLEKVIDNVDRKDVDYFCKMTGIEGATDFNLIGIPLDVEIVEREDMVEVVGYGCSIIVSGCDEMIADEAERAMNDVFGVVGALMNEPYIVPGGGSIETGISILLEKYNGPHSLILNEIGKGVSAMPYYLAQNAGINPIHIVSQLKKHIDINHNMGISLKTGSLGDMVNDDKIIQPAAVAKSMIILAFEATQVLIRVDDILPAIQ